jgi:hypothetical protein
MAADPEEAHDPIAELNTKHFVVRIGKNVVVGTEAAEEVFFQTFSDFEKSYYNRYVGKARLGHVWLGHPDRRTFDEVRLCPPGAPTPPKRLTYFNLWRGFAVEAMRGDPRPYLQRYLYHTYEIVANGEPHHAEYVLDLMAAAVQTPGRPVGKALALRSAQGLGKSVFIEAFGKLFGSHFVSLSSRAQLTGAFNGHLSGKIVVFADEAIWGGNRQDIGVLKHFVTQRTIPIQYKGIDIMFQPNYAHLFLATNEDWAWPAGNEERRGVILDLHRRMPPAYFEALWAEVEAPQFGPALLAFLQARTIDYARLRLGLDTEGLRQQKELTASVTQQWWKQVLEEGGWGPKFDWPTVAPVATLYQRFIEDMGSTRGPGQSHRATKSVFSKAIQAMIPSATIERMRATIDSTPGRNPTFVTQPTPCLILPTLDVARAAYDEITGSRHAWPNVADVHPELLGSEAS